MYATGVEGWRNRWPWNRVIMDFDEIMDLFGPQPVTVSILSEGASTVEDWGVLLPPVQASAGSGLHSR